MSQATQCPPSNPNSQGSPVNCKAFIAGTLFLDTWRVGAGLAASMQVSRQVASLNFLAKMESSTEKVSFYFLLQRERWQSLRGEGDLSSHTQDTTWEGPALCLQQLLGLTWPRESPLHSVSNKTHQGEPCKQPPIQPDGKSHLPSAHHGHMWGRMENWLGMTCQVSR